MFSIIIPVFNNSNLTMSALNQLNYLTDHEIIIIDNNSTDDTDIFCRFYRKNNYRYIKNSENLYHSLACNQGYSIAKYDNIIFLNNDIDIFKPFQSNWTNLVFKEIQDDMIIGATGGLLDKDFNFKYETQEPNKEYNYLGGWFLAGNKKTFDKLKIVNGPFNPKLPFYFNDADLSFRAKQNNIKLKMIGLPVLHIGKQTAKKGNVSKLYKDGRKAFLEIWKNTKIQ